MIEAERIFVAVADALLAEGADERTQHDVLAAVMDRIGVPARMLERYREQPAIVALFAERGVRFATPEEIARGKPSGC
jgi:hypothetical protein